MDVSRADGELRCPMAGEGQHVTVAQPHAVEAVGRLVAIFVVHSDIESADVEMHSEEMTLHRGFQPVAEFGLNSQKTQAVVACHGVGALDDRQIDRVVVAETVLHAEVGDRSGQICHIGFNGPAIKRTYGVEHHSLQCLNDRLCRF